MKVRIIAIGKVKKAWISDGIQQYLKRLPEVEIVEIKDATPDKEQAKILSILKPNERMILLWEGGKTFTSASFAQWLEPMGLQPLAFVVGGPEGLAPSLYSQADQVLSLSPMTFPHELARLLLVEQLYRAKTILQNTGYHK